MIAPSPTNRGAARGRCNSAQQESVMCNQVKDDLYSGVLLGSGRKSRCRVRVLMKLVNNRPPVVFEYHIVSAEKSLPEGDYQLLLDWETLNVRLQDGEWLVPLS